jgi:hypothetical protein
MTTSVWPCVNVSAQGVPPRDPDSEASPCLRADRGHMRMSIRPTPQCDSRSCPEVPFEDMASDLLERRFWIVSGLPTIHLESVQRHTKSLSPIELRTWVSKV